MTKDGEIQEDKRNLDHYTCFYGKIENEKNSTGNVATFLAWAPTPFYTLVLQLLRFMMLFTIVLHPLKLKLL